MDNADDGFIMADAKTEDFCSIRLYAWRCLLSMEMHGAPMGMMTVGMDSFPSLAAR